MDSVWIIAASVTIFGILFMPKDIDQKLPAIFCLLGGGDIGISNYLYEAEHFAKAGIASIVCDKAGSGLSKGKSTCVTQSFRQKINEYSSVLEWLLSQNFVDITKIGIHGPSEGGSLALSLAHSNKGKIKFINAISTPMKSFKENQLFSIEKLLIRDRYKFSIISLTLYLFEKYFDAIHIKIISESLIQKVNQFKDQFPNLYLTLNSNNLPKMPHPDDINCTEGTDISKIDCPIYFQYGENGALVNIGYALKQIQRKQNVKNSQYKDAEHYMDITIR